MEKERSRWSFLESRRKCLDILQEQMRESTCAKETMGRNISEYIVVRITRPETYGRELILQKKGNKGA